MLYDDKWRVIARFEDAASASAPFEQIYHHHAGLAGHGGSSYIDLVICRDQIDNSGDPPTATRDYVLQNWRADVVALAAPDGDLLERVTYDAYGIPFATHPTDLTKGAIGGVAGYGMPDGTLNNDDYFYYQARYAATDWRADWDRDGDIDAADNTAYLADKAAASGSWGRGVLSNRGNILGYAGYVHEPATGSAGSGHGTMWHVRQRVLHSGLGRWVQRDPPEFEYREGPSLYWYGMAAPLENSDPNGTACSPLGCCTVTVPDHKSAPQPVLPRPIIGCLWPDPGHLMRMRCEQWARCTAITKFGSGPQSSCFAAAVAAGVACCMNNGTAASCEDDIAFELGNCVHDPCFLVPLQPPNAAWCRGAYGACDSYAGANARCFCECGGDSPWSNFVRACLECKHRNGQGSHSAHIECYTEADLRYGTNPHGMLGCYCACVVVQVMNC